MYFDGSTVPARCLLRLLQRARWLPRSVEPVRQNIASVRTSDGTSEYPALFARARAIAAAIRQDQWDENALLIHLSWNAQKVALHLEKQAEHWARTECLRIRMARWIATEHRVPPDRHIVLLTTWHPWLSHLMAFATEQRVQLRSYRRPHFITRQTMRRVLGIGQRVARGVVRRMWRSPEQQRTYSTGPTSVIASRYYYQSLGFDPARRSELFWLAFTEARGYRVLVYDYSREWPLERGTSATLRARGVQVVQRGQELLGVRDGYTMLRLTTKHAWHVARAAAKSVRDGRLPQARLLWELLSLAGKVAYWETFFGARGVRLHIGTVNTDVPQILALDSLGAVSVGFQYAISFLVTGSTTMLSAGEDVQFVFSPEFGSVWDGIKPLPRARVQIGYLYDSAIPLLKSSKEPALLRQRLAHNGAEFVVCFFDENSVARWDVPAPHAEAAHDYRSLAEWVLADPSLGVIVKTKKASDLYDRLGDVLPILQQAKATGRLLITADDPTLAHLYPAEAALATDVAIGKLLGATAAFEASRAGVRTVLVDTDGFRDHPFWTETGGRIVLPDWPTVRAAIEAFRKSGGADRAFGVWLREAEISDGYRDFRAGERFAKYIELLVTALASGASKQEAIAAATAAFREEWGYQRITTDAAEADAADDLSTTVFA
jgi:hypothetical protein